MQAVILVAGKGTRLGEINGGKPKCMTLLGGQTIIERQLDALKAIGVNHIVIVIGYKKDIIIDLVGRKYDCIHFVENKEYGETNTIYSLFLAFPFLKEDFFYLNGDVVFQKSLLERLMMESGTGLAIEYKSCGEEEVKVRLKDERIIEISKTIDTRTTAGEFVGVALFRKQMHDVFFNCLKYGIEKQGLVKEYFEWALNRIAMTTKLNAVDVSMEPVVEIDFAEDLEKAKSMVEAMHLDVTGNRKAVNA